MPASTKVFFMIFGDALISDATWSAIVDANEHWVVFERFSCGTGLVDVVLQGNDRAEEGGSKALVIVVGMPAMSLSVLPPKLAMFTPLLLKTRWLRFMRARSDGR